MWANSAFKQIYFVKTRWCGGNTNTNAQKGILAPYISSLHYLGPNRKALTVTNVCSKLGLSQNINAEQLIRSSSVCYSDVDASNVPQAINWEGKDTLWTNAFTFVGSPFGAIMHEEKQANVQAHMLHNLASYCWLHAIPLNDSWWWRCARRGPQASKHRNRQPTIWC